jgi:5'-3' exonuclease
MGIKDLNKFIKKHSVRSVSVKNLKELVVGKNSPVIAIDGNNLMYRYLYYSNIDSFSHITFLLKQINMFKDHGIFSIVVFDGKSPIEKNFTHLKRTDNKIKLQDKILKLEKMQELCLDNMSENMNEFLNICSSNSKIMASINEILIIPSSDDKMGSSIDTHVSIIEEDKKIEQIKEIVKKQLNSSKKCDIHITHRHFKEVKQFLKLINCPVIESCGEGEATCSELVKMGIADYVLSMDVDTLVFGAQRSIRFYKNKEHDVFDLYELEPLLEDTQLTMEQFIDFCILCVCDYTGTIYNIGPVNAYKLIKEHKNIENILQYLESQKNSKDPKIVNKFKDISWNNENFKYIEARNLFNSDMYKNHINSLEFPTDWKLDFMNPDKIDQESLVIYLENINMSDKIVKKIIQNIYKPSNLKNERNDLKNYSILNYII